MSLPIAIVGGGTFGRALAKAASIVGRRVILWTRRSSSLDDENVTCTQELADLAEAELLFLAVPSRHVPELAGRLGEHLDGRHLVVHVSRGLVGHELRTLTEILRERTAVRRVGALAGPLVAPSLASNDPSGAIVGTLFEEVASAVRGAIGGPALRLYSTSDVVGVQMASAWVGLIALALGYAKGCGFGPGTLAVLATRGMAEATRVGCRRGADERTFAGLAGYGDLLAAVAGDDRPETGLGQALARGEDLDAAAKALGGHVEGVSIARHIVEYGLRNSVEAPLAGVMARLVEGEASAQAAIGELMSRPARGE